VNSQSKIPERILSATVIVAALGYFVDIYDLILFGIVKEPSLRDIGVLDEDMFAVGTHLLNMQMIGMLLGGIIWGVLGDKKGRLSTLFLTILLYSLANIANGFVQTEQQYAVLRFIAGVGLAGELGVGITLVSEVLSKESRGIGTSIVAGVGIAGAVLSFLVADWFDWRTAYFVGGGLGLLLLILRVSVHESGMFKKTKTQSVSKGNFFMLFTNSKRTRKYIATILIGIPVWYVISQMVINSGTYAKEALGIVEKISGAKAVVLHYIGASVGSMVFGLLSHYLKSRKKVILIANASLALFVFLFFFMKGVSANIFYLNITLMGVAMGGLWAVFMSSASEQFGTNLRATVTTTAPNFVRGTTVLISWAILSLKVHFDLWTAGLIVGIICLVLSFVALLALDETHGKELDYFEEV